MKRILIAGVAGAIVLFVWSSISWMVIPWHRMEKLPAEAAVAQTLRVANTEKGVYWLPGIDFSIDQSALTGAETTAMQDAWKQAYKDGPIVMIAYDPDGTSPLRIMKFITGFVLDFFVAAVAAILLMLAAPSLPGLPGRVIFVVLLGVYTVFGANLMNWNWMNYPLKFTLEIAGDTLVASALLGVTLAVLVRPGSESEDDIDYEVPAGA